MSGFLEIIQSLDREINNIVSEYGNEGDESAETKRNTVDSTAKNVVNDTAKNVVDVTSKNFVTATSSNVIQSPFIGQQTHLKSLTVLRKGDGQEQSGDIVNRIKNILKL